MKPPPNTLIFRIINEYPIGSKLPRKSIVIYQIICYLMKTSISFVSFVSFEKEEEKRPAEIGPRQVEIGKPP